MERSTLSVTVGDTYDGQHYTQTTTEEGTESYAIDGKPVDKVTWEAAFKASQENEMINQTCPLSEDE